MVKIRWSDDAIADFEAIIRYLAHDAPDYAQFFMDELFDKLELLKEFPRMGHQVGESDDPNDKEVHCENYRIIYQLLDEKTIKIITIVHGSRQYNPHKTHSR